MYLECMNFMGVEVDGCVGPLFCGLLGPRLWAYLYRQNPLTARAVSLTD
jgi:hypothetical protein